MWQKAFGGLGHDEAYAICPASGGGFVVAGYSMSYGTGFSDVYVIKVDKSGNPMWIKNFGQIPYEDEAYSVCPGNGGGYVIAGRIASSSTNSKSYVLRVDDGGNLIWQKIIGGDGDDLAYSICPGNGGGYIVAGRTSSFNAAGVDVYVAKLSENGDTVWQKALGTDFYDRAYSVCQANGGGYVISGITWMPSSYGVGSYDVYVLKIDEDGNIIWQKTFGGNLEDFALAVSPANGGGYVIAGYTTSYGAGCKDIYVLRIDEDGNLQWQKTHGGTNDEEAYSITKASGSGYVIAGYTASYGPSQDVFVLRINEDGSVQQFIKDGPVVKQK